MRHRVRGRKLGRSPSHRKAMFRNMACSLIRSVREYPELSEKQRLDRGLGYAPKVPGRIITTPQKAKELRPFVEKLITLARKAAVIEEKAGEFATSAERNSDEWRSWRESEQWNNWNQAIAPAVAMRRRAFALLRDHEAVDILFDELAERFADRPGGYTRIARLATVRLGDSGQQALIEFVGERDREKRERREAPAVVDDEPQTQEETPAVDEQAGEETKETETDAQAESEDATLAAEDDEKKDE